MHEVKTDMNRSVRAEYARGDLGYARWMYKILAIDVLQSEAPLRDRGSHGRYSAEYSR